MGRIQYLKFTIYNSIAYWIRGTIIPKSCYKILDKMCSRLLYSSDIHSHKVRLISWLNTCKPTLLGGIGINRC